MALVVARGQAGQVREEVAPQLELDLAADADEDHPHVVAEDALHRHHAHHQARRRAQSFARVTPTRQVVDRVAQDPGRGHGEARWWRAGRRGRRAGAGGGGRGRGGAARRWRGGFAKRRGQRRRGRRSRLALAGPSSWLARSRRGKVLLLPGQRLAVPGVARLRLAEGARVVDGAARRGRGSPPRWWCSISW